VAELVEAMPHPVAEPVEAVEANCSMLELILMKGFMYILQCSDGSYYTGSTNDLELRIAQHQSGIGSRHTSLRLPVELVYVEEFPRIDEAFEREKQVQGWRREKKQALIRGEYERLVELAATASKDSVTSIASTGSATGSVACSVAVGVTGSMTVVVTDQWFL
jgi:putative endonuclease